VAIDSVVGFIHGIPRAGGIRSRLAHLRTVGGGRGHQEVGVQGAGARGPVRCVVVGRRGDDDGWDGPGGCPLAAGRGAVAGGIGECRGAGEEPRGVDGLPHQDVVRGWQPQEGLSIGRCGIAESGAQGLGVVDKRRNRGVTDGRFFRRGGVLPVEERVPAHRHGQDGDPFERGLHHCGFVSGSGGGDGVGGEMDDLSGCDGTHGQEGGEDGTNLHWQRLRGGPPPLDGSRQPKKCGGTQRGEGVCRAMLRKMSSQPRLTDVREEGGLRHSRWEPVAGMMFTFTSRRDRGTDPPDHWAGRSPGSAVGEGERIRRRWTQPLGRKESECKDGMEDPCAG